MRAFLIGLFVVSVAVGYPLTPDPDATSGEVCSTSDSDFTEYRYPEKIPYCERHVVYSLKQRIYDDYGIPVAERKDYTIDHLVPLSLGGNNRMLNLWPEHKAVKALRPNLEYERYVRLRSAAITQADAIHKIVYAKFHPKPVRQSVSPADPMWRRLSSHSVGPSLP